MGQQIRMADNDLTFHESGWLNSNLIHEKLSYLLYSFKNFAVSILGELSSLKSP